ncbi:hypothetical protein C8Q77DRAFT_1154818 [Trametes polyzona]|nr:hypothetical protein C8Q77DRAFT_1154818 [Trametes polyzona]
MTHYTHLRTYALMDPADVPAEFKLTSSDTSITIHDRFPKGYYHELVLPRVLPPLTTRQLSTLRTLLMLPREQARAVLLGLRRDALEAKRLIEEDMRARYGFVWDVLIGFHAVPSVEYVLIPLRHLIHLHLHVISVDFLGEALKTKKHVNSFHPRLGFFLHIDEVIRWFDPDIEPTWFAMKSTLDKKEYEPLLKGEMLCPHCDAPFKTIPKIKKHFRAVFRKMQEDALEAAAQGTSAEGAGPDAEAVAVPNDGTVDEAAAVPESSVDSRTASTEDGVATPGAGQKRKHAETAGDEPEVIDVDALPDAEPTAKRHQVGGAGTASS